MTEPLTHTGAPPPVHKNRRRANWPLWAAPIVILLGLAAVVGGYIIAGGPEPIREMLGMGTKASPAMSAETQVECANIKHAYAVWHGGVADITSLDMLPPDMVGFRTKNLVEQGKTFLDAVSGHKDQPSKHLAVAVADYNVKISFLNLGLQLADSFDAGDYKEASDAWSAVEVAYKDFMAQTCPSSA